jgi:hypothetical protein
MEGINERKKEHNGRRYERNYSLLNVNGLFYYYIYIVCRDEMETGAIIPTGICSCLCELFYDAVSI